MSKDSESARRSVIVTGGARGIGASIAARFAAAGDDVTVADLVKPASDGVGVRYVETDVAVETSVSSLVKSVLHQTGRVDVLVNNAGIWFARPFTEITSEEWDKVINVNLRGTYLCTQSVIGPMSGSGGGSIINIGSQAGVAVTRGQGAHYHASKAAISHLTTMLAFELGPCGIRINTVAPGATPTQPSVFPSKLLDQIPLGRAGRGEDIAAMAYFLSTEESAFVTGQTILVNGGAVAFL